MPSRKISNSGFTLLEIMIVIAIIAIIAVAMFILLNPMKQVQKSWDSKRKGELSTLQKFIEDWYNDNNGYPNASQICVPGTTTVSRTDNYDNLARTCKICGKDPQSPQIPQLSQLPCDPQWSAKEYLYDFDNDPTHPNPLWYRIYTKLSRTDDPDSTRVGCESGCGPDPEYAYNYAVSSTNTGLETNNNIHCSTKSPLYVKDLSGNCNICGSPSTYINCKIAHPDPSEIYYINPSCLTTCIKD